MKKYEYKVLIIPYSMWTGKAKLNYVDVLNEYGLQGWKFKQFSKSMVKHDGVRGREMIFERIIQSDI